MKESERKCLPETEVISIKSLLKRGCEEKVR